MIKQLDGTDKVWHPEWTTYRGAPSRAPRLKSLQTPTQQGTGGSKDPRALCHRAFRDFPVPGSPRLFDSLCQEKSNYFLNPVLWGEGSTDKFIISAEMEVQKKGMGLFTRTNCSLWKGLGLEAKVCGSQPGWPFCF